MRVDSSILHHQVYQLSYPTIVPVLKLTRVNIAKSSRSLYQKRATCYEYPNTDCSVCRQNTILKILVDCLTDIASSNQISDAVACVNTVARKTNCFNTYLQCQIGGCVLTTDGSQTSNW